MEKSNSQKIQLGIFVIIGTLVFLAAIYFIGNKQNMFGNTSHLKATFVNVNGLQPGNNVRYAGIDIGTVKEIEMVNDTTINLFQFITFNHALSRIVEKGELSLSFSQLF